MIALRPRPAGDEPERAGTPDKASPFAALPVAWSTAATRQRLTGAELAVLFAIATRIHQFRVDDGRPQPIRYQDLTEATGLHRATVIEAVATIRELGMITVTGSRGKVANRIGLTAPSSWANGRRAGDGRRVGDGYPSPRTRRLNGRHVGDGPKEATVTSNQENQGKTPPTPLAAAAAMNGHTDESRWLTDRELDALLGPSRPHRFTREDRP